MLQPEPNLEDKVNIENKQTRNK